MDCLLLQNTSNLLKVELYKLSEEFDSLGLPTINTNVDVLHQVITTASRLVNMYRQSLTKFKEFQITHSQLEEEMKMKTNKIKLLKDDIKEVEAKFCNGNQKNTNLQNEIDELKNSLEAKDRDLQRARQYNKHKDIEWLHKVKHLQSEIDRLKCEPSLVKSQNQDTRLLNKIAQYKQKEQIYEKTIHFLEENNHELQRQMLDLREDILVICQKQDAAENHGHLKNSLESDN